MPDKIMTGFFLGCAACILTGGLVMFFAEFSKLQVAVPLLEKEMLQLRKEMVDLSKELDAHQKFRK